MSSKLAELFQKKHYWEVKRDDLYNRILWDYQASAVWLITLGFYVLLFMQRGSLFLSDVKWSWEWYNVLRILVFVIGMFFFDCLTYYTIHFKCLLLINFSLMVSF